MMQQTQKFLTYANGAAKTVIKICQVNSGALPDGGLLGDAYAYIFDMIQTYLAPIVKMEPECEDFYDMVTEIMTADTADEIEGIMEKYCGV